MRKENEVKEVEQTKEMDVVWQFITYLEELDQREGNNDYSSYSG